MGSALIQLSLLISVAKAYTCYYPDSTPYVNTPDAVWTACNASATVSTCCSTIDYCLSNGICFQAGENNLLATQGCTDPNWGAPCHAFCPSIFPGILLLYALGLRFSRICELALSLSKFSSKFSRSCSLVLLRYR